MRHRNNVKQLGKTPAHRDAMFSNMIASLYIKESIVTTKPKAKELKRRSEKLITKAKRNIKLGDNETGKKLHNKRLVMKEVKNEDAVKKLFDDIAPRYAERNGGYTRIYLLGRRLSDSTEMVIVELVDKKKAPVKAKEKTADAEVKDKKAKKEKKDKKEKKSKKAEE